MQCAGLAFSFKYGIAIIQNCMFDYILENEISIVHHLSFTIRRVLHYLIESVWVSQKIIPSLLIIKYKHVYCNELTCTM